jgi:hypothetical protein
LVDALIGGEAFVKLIGAILSALTTLWRIVTGGWDLYASGLKVKRITRPEDDDFVAARELHEQFPDAVADDFADVARWLEETHDNLDDILMVSKLKNDVVGYLYAQYYRDSKYIFVSYIAINKDVPEARKHAAYRMLTKLLKYIKRQGYSWKALIGEIEEFRPRHYDRGVEYVPHARQLMVTFQLCIRKIALKLRLNTDVYRLYFEYRQPALRPEDILTRDTLDDRELKQWLLYMPRDKATLKRANGTLRMSKEEALGILRFVLLQTYADAHEGNQQYLAHLQRELATYTIALSQDIELTRSPRR